jgi:hypothetical protein
MTERPCGEYGEWIKAFLSSKLERIDTGEWRHTQIWLAMKQITILSLKWKSPIQH